jgi:hypothetical protein
MTLQGRLVSPQRGEGRSLESDKQSMELTASLSHLHECGDVLWAFCARRYSRSRVKARAVFVRASRVLATWPCLDLHSPKFAARYMTGSAFHRAPCICAHEPSALEYMSPSLEYALTAGDGDGVTPTLVALGWS